MSLPPSDPGTRDLRTRLLIVLHGHIPQVVGQGTWPHGANWLYEAAAETYLPFLRVVSELRAEGIPIKATIGLTPVLAEQLLDPRFKTGFRWYLRQRARAANEDREAFLVEKDERAAALAEAWRDLYLYLREQFEALPDQDIVRVFRELADAGEIEPMASAATHGFLPLLPNDRAIERQLDVGLAAFERHWGRPAHGIWIPECAYRPPGLWVSPADGHAEIRPGIEDFLAARGVRFFFVETHLVAGGLTPAAYGGNVFRDYEGQSPYRTHAVRAIDGTPVGVFARDPLSSQQVWSGVVGYPGDPRYLEFHKKSGSGHRYWRVTDSKADLAFKKLYEPEKVHSVVSQHAAHFISMLRQVEPLSDGTPGLVVGMFDFELFGHWWFEGPSFLGELMRQVSKEPGIKMVTAWEALQETPPTSFLTMPPGTWGRNGTFEVWWNEHTVEYWQTVTRIEEHMEVLEERAREGKLSPELFEALERQTLLLQSSDWPFLIDNESARDYAEERILRHATDFELLARVADAPESMQREVLDEIAKRDRSFGPELAGRTRV